MNRNGTSFVALAAVAIASAWGCAKPPSPTAFERPPAPVTVAAAVGADVPLYLDEVGKTVAREVVSVRPQVSGRITEIRFADGADVRAGDPLFLVDPRPYRAALDAAEAGLAEAKASLDLAKVEFERIASLVESKAVSRADYDAKKSAVAVADARVRSGEAAVETARLDLDYCDIRSPLDGRAGERLVDAGNVVTPDGGPLLVIQRLDPVYAEFTVTEKDLAAVQASLSRGTLRAEVRLPDGGAAPRAGEITFLDNAVTEGTGTVRLRATLPNADRAFWPGRFVRIRLVLETLPGAVLVPAAALQVSAKGPYAYVVGADSSAELRPLRTGQRQGERIVVLEGLRPGERVVVTGQIAVMPGGKVRVEEPVAAAAGTAAGGGGR
jgi:multidrug efflux system membrane fusion protein